MNSIPENIRKCDSNIPANKILHNFPESRRCKSNTCPCENCNISGNICEECINISSHYNWSTTNTPVIKCSNDACSNAYCIQCLIKEDPNINPSTFRICSDFKNLQQQECTTNDDLFGNLLFSLFNELPSNISNDQYFKSLWSSENIKQEEIFAVQRNIAKHYFSFKLNEYHYRIQDCVSIKTEGCDAIARICDIFTTNDQTLNCKILVQWFLSPKHFFSLYSNSYNDKLEFGDKEIIFESTYFDVLNIHTLEKKVLVCNNAREQKMEDIKLQKFNCDRKRGVSRTKSSLMRARNPNVNKCLINYGLNFYEFGDVFYCIYECGIGDDFSCIQQSNTSVERFKIQKELKEKYGIVSDEVGGAVGSSFSNHSLASKAFINNRKRITTVNNDTKMHKRLRNEEKKQKSQHINWGKMELESNGNGLESSVSPDIVIISGSQTNVERDRKRHLSEIEEDLLSDDTVNNHNYENTNASLEKKRKLQMFSEQIGDKEQNIQQIMNQKRKLPEFLEKKMGDVHDGNEMKEIEEQKTPQIINQIQTENNANRSMERLEDDAYTAERDTNVKHKLRKQYKQRRNSCGKYHSSRSRYHSCSHSRSYQQFCSRSKYHGICKDNCDEHKNHRKRLHGCHQQRSHSCFHHRSGSRTHPCHRYRRRVAYHSPVECLFSSSESDFSCNSCSFESAPLKNVSLLATNANNIAHCSDIICIANKNSANASVIKNHELKALITQTVAETNGTPNEEYKKLLQKYNKILEDGLAEEKQKNEILCNLSQNSMIKYPFLPKLPVIRISDYGQHFSLNQQPMISLPFPKLAGKQSETNIKSVDIPKFNIF